MINNPGSGPAQSQGAQPGEEHVQHFRELLLNGNIDEALKYMLEYSFSTQIVQNNARDAFELHKDTEQYQVALRIANEFKFADTHIQVIKIAEWNRLNKEKLFEEAAEWGLKQELPETEIRRSAIMAYEKCINDGKTENALRIMEDYKLAKEELLAYTITEFNRAFNDGEFYKAALLGEKFNFSTVRTMEAAYKACIASLNKDDFELTVDIIDKFKLVSEELFKYIPEKEAARLFMLIQSNLVEPAFERGKFKLMSELSSIVPLAQHSFQQNVLQDFIQQFYSAAVRAHNALLQKEEVKPARFIRDTFNLFVAPIPYNLFSTLVESAEKYHGVLLQNEDLTHALTFKKEYGLFTKYTVEGSKKTAVKQGSDFVIAALEKAQIKPALAAVKEYNVPKEIANESVLTAVLDLVDKKLFKEAYLIMDEFKVEIAKESDRLRVVDRFESLMKDKQFVQAVEFAKRLRLYKSYINDAAFKAWRNEFNQKRFGEALEIKIRFKIGRKATLPLAKNAYWVYYNAEDYASAVAIRRAYKVPVGFIQMMIEFFRNIFSR